MISQSFQKHAPTAGIWAAAKQYNSAENVGALLSGSVLVWGEYCVTDDWVRPVYGMASGWIPTFPFSKEVPMIHLDFPTNRRIDYVPQNLVGWVSWPEKIHTLEMYYYDQRCELIMIDRPDCDIAFPHRSNIGWCCFFNITDYKLPKHQFELTYYVNGDLGGTIQFQVSRALTGSRDKLRPLYWIHIPKTAGTSVWHAISERFSGHRSLRVYDEPYAVPISKVHQIPVSYLNNVEIVFGHFPFGVHRLFGRTGAYATVLRDPVQLVLSYMAFTGREDSDHFFFDNPMTRFLSSGISHKRLMKNYDLELAKSNILNNFVFVGFSETIHETEKWLRSTYGEGVLPIDYKNVTEKPKRVNLPDYVRVDLDKELYNWATAQKHRWTL